MKTKSKKDSRVDEYIRKASPFAKPFLVHLRKFVHESCPDAVETIKWGKPWYVYQDKVLCGLVPFKAHFAFLFNKASHIVDAKGKPAKSAMWQLRHLAALSDLPSTRELKFYLKQAMKLNVPGALPVKRRVVRMKPPVKAPSDLLTALRGTPKALAKYEEMSESIRRHYVEWIAEAKTEETREKRLEKSVEAIAAGKQRHWK